MAKSAVVSSKGQVTLPKALRDRPHLEEGQTVLILETGDGVLIRHRRHTLRGLRKGRIDADEAERALHELRRDWTL